MLVGFGAIGELHVVGVPFELGAGHLYGDHAEHGEFRERATVGGEVAAGLGAGADRLEPVAAMLQAAGMLWRLYEAFVRYDALIAEINPLMVTKAEDAVAADAVLEVDDAALYRYPQFRHRAEERISDPLEREAKRGGVSYVALDGDIGIICSGAGLGMATMDLIRARGRPANFLETGGAITADLLYQTMNLIMTKKGLRAVFINLYGGINPIHEGAKGVVRYIKEHDTQIPIVAKALGNRQEETWEILRSGGVHVVTDVATEKAVEKLIEILG